MKEKVLPLILRMLLLFGLVLGACAAPAAPAAVEAPAATEASAPTEAPAPTAVPAATEAPAPSDGAAAEQVLRLAIDGGPGNGPVPGLDFGTAAGPMWTYMPIMVMTQEGELVPGLANKMFINPKQTQFVFKIDPEAVWSDGEEVTANQIKDWYEFIWHPARLAGPSAQNFSGIIGWTEFQDGTAKNLQGVIAVDAKTLRINLVNPGPTFKYAMATIYSAPGRVEQYVDSVKGVEAIPKEQYAAMSAVWGGDNAANLIVNGPFKFERIAPEPEGVYNFVPNPNFWGVKPRLTRIEVITMRDPQTMALMFEAADLDLAFVTGPPAVKLRQQFPDTFKQKPVWGIWTMFFMTGRKPSDDLNLRKALLHAIEWEKVASVAWEGEQPSIENGQFIAPGVSCRDDAFAPYPFDLAKAKEYLALSKYGPEGKDVPRINLRMETDSPRQRASQIIAEMWRVNLGIEDIVLEVQESAFTDGAEKIAIRSASAGGAFPLMHVFAKNAFKSGGWIATNGTQYSSPEWDEKIDKLDSMDPNSADYCPLASEFYKETVDQALLIPMGYIASWRQEQPWLQGYEESQTSFAYNMQNVWLKEH